MLVIFSIALLCLQLHTIAADEPALKVRVTKQGLDYASKVAMEILDDTAKTVHLPDIDLGKINVSKLQITKFNAPTADVSLQPPATLLAALHGASIDLSAHVRGCERILGINICDAIDVDMDASDVSFSLIGVVGRKADDQERPTILGVDCQAVIGTLKLKTSGGVVGWLLNLFSSLLSKEVKPKIQKAVCDQAKQFLLTTANDELAKIPVETVIGKKIQFQLDYGLVSDPVISTNFLEVDLKGQVSYPNKPSIVSPYPSTPLVEQVEEPRMAYAFVSDKIANDLLYIAHEANLTFIHMTKDTPKFGPSLMLHCGSLTWCVGSLIPNVTEMFPTVDAAEVTIVTAEPPSVTITTDGRIVIDAKLAADLFAPTTPQQSIIKTTVGIGASITVKIDNMRLVGQVNVTNLSLNDVQTILDPALIQEWQYDLDVAIKPFIEDVVNAQLAKGLAIPSFKQITLENAQIRLLDRTIQLESDATYVKKAK